MGKYVFISATNSTGGAEQCLALTAEASNGRVIFLTQNSENPLAINGHIKTRFLNRTSLFLGFILLPIALFKYRRGYKIVSSHAYINAVVGFLKRIKYLNSTIIVRESTEIFTRFTGFKRFTYKVSYRLGYPGVDLIICQTNTMLKQLIDNNKFIDVKKVVCIANPVNMGKIQNFSVQCIETIPAEFICAAGRLITLKGFDLLINAFSKISDIYPKLNLIILGSGPEKQKLIKLAKQLNLEDRVLLPGFVSNPYPYFRKARLCVVPSVKEGFPNVLLQMISLNTNVVTTLCAGGIEDIPNVIKVKPNSVDGLVNGMLTILKTNTQLFRKDLDYYIMSRTPESFLFSINKSLQLQFTN